MIAPTSLLAEDDYAKQQRLIDDQQSEVVWQELVSLDPRFAFLLECTVALGDCPHSLKVVYARFNELMSSQNVSSEKLDRLGVFGGRKLKNTWTHANGRTYDGHDILAAALERQHQQRRGLCRESLRDRVSLLFVDFNRRFPHVKSFDLSGHTADVLEEAVARVSNDRDGEERSLVVAELNARFRPTSAREITLILATARKSSEGVPNEGTP